LKLLERNRPSPVNQQGLHLQHEPQGKLLGHAVAERFLLNPEMERVWQCDYANHSQARIDIANYIVGFYNSERLHSVLGNLSPFIYERQMAAPNILMCPKLLDHHSFSPCG
jgi:putative transposase